MPDLYDEIKAMLRHYEIQILRWGSIDGGHKIIADLDSILSRHKKPEPSAPQKVEIERLPTNYDRRLSAACSGEVVYKWRCKTCGEDVDASLVGNDGHPIGGAFCGPVERGETPKPIEFMDRPYAKRGEK